MVLVLPLNKKSDWARTFVEAVNTPFGATLIILFSFAVGAGLSIFFPPSDSRSPVVPAFDRAAAASTAPISAPPPPIRTDAAAPASTEPVSAPPPPIRIDAAAPASTEPVSAPPSPTPTAASPASLVSVPPRPNSTGAMPDRQAQLFKRGADFLKDGNVAAARLMLRSVADAGSAQAALLLGATYDPIILANLGVRGLEPDRVAAIAWYRRAQEYGASEASGRIASGRIERLTEADR